MDGVHVLLAFHSDLLSHSALHDVDLPGKMIGVIQALLRSSAVIGLGLSAISLYFLTHGLAVYQLNAATQQFDETLANACLLTGILVSGLHVMIQLLLFLSAYHSLLALLNKFLKYSQHSWQLVNEETRLHYMFITWCRRTVTIILLGRIDCLFRDVKEK